MDKSVVPVNQIAVRSSTCYEFSNPRAAEVVEIEDDPVKTVEKQMEDLKLNYQFNEKDVPKVFQTLINKKMGRLTEIDVHIHEKDCTMVFYETDEIEVRLEKRGDDWIISCKNTDETIKTDDPEKSIIDHLWFVLKNPNIKLNFIRIEFCKDSCSELSNQEIENGRSQKLDFQKLNTLLQSMFNSFDHQFQTSLLACAKFNENTLFSMLKKVKPGALEIIMFDISKREGSYQKMKEIVETDQWKQAKKISSLDVIPQLKIEDLLHCEFLVLTFDKITPEYVLRVKELFINSTNSKICILLSDNENLDIDAFRKVLLPNILKEEKVKTEGNYGFVFTYKLPNSPNHLSVLLNKIKIRFEKIPKLF